MALTLILALNTHNVNLTPAMRRKLIDEVPDILLTIGASGVRVNLSFSKLDQLICGIDPKKLPATIHMMGSAVARPLVSSLGGNPYLNDHLIWQFENGVAGDAPSMFLPNFDLPMNFAHVKLDHTIYPIIGRSRNPMSEKVRTVIDDTAPVNRYKALSLKNGNYALPMKGVQPLIDAFNAFQVDLHPVLRDRVVTSARDLANHEDHFIAYLNIDGAYSGSTHGRAVWSTFLPALTAAGIKLVTLDDTVEEWRMKAASAPQLPLAALTRTQEKYLSYPTQHQHFIACGQIQSQRDDAMHFTLAYALLTDVLSGLGRKEEGFFTTTFEAPDTMPRIGYDQTIIDLGRLCLKEIAAQPALNIDDVEAQIAYKQKKHGQDFDLHQAMRDMKAQQVRRGFGFSLARLRDTIATKAEKHPDPNAAWFINLVNEKIFAPLQ